MTIRTKTKTRRKPSRKPGAFSADDPAVTMAAPEPADLPVAMEEATEAPPPTILPTLGELKRGMNWGSLLLSAIGGLAMLAVGMWATDFVRDLFARQDWIGWTALGLSGLTVFAALMLAAREAVALLRLQKLERIHRNAERALNSGDKPAARKAVASLKGLFAKRANTAWGRAQLAEHEGDIMDARETLILAERLIVAPLDGGARAIVAASAKRVSVVTAISPAALIDMAFVAMENMRMLRKLATLYGGRPGTFGLLKLARMVLAHIALTGGIAITDDLVQQMIGHGLAAKLSARLGEGLFNGALTARIGLAAIDVTRALPFIEAKRPRLRDFVAEIARGKGKE